ncbi:MAG: tyrosine-type recombinase/integrase [Akkermansia sp.]|nr:tyrosine-type recombinase/integrase [Akkermansia sp.]
MGGRARPHATCQPHGYHTPAQAPRGRDTPPHPAPARCPPTRRPTLPHRAALPRPLRLRRHPPYRGHTPHLERPLARRAHHLRALQILQNRRCPPHHHPPRPRRLATPHRTRTATGTHSPLCPIKRRNLRKIKEAAHLSGAAWQADVLRHSFASYALKAGTSLADLQLDMGHRDASMLRARYLNMAGLTRQLADAYWALTPANILNTPAN